MSSGVYRLAALLTARVSRLYGGHVKRGLVLVLLFTSCIPARSAAVPVIVSNCHREPATGDPTTWQTGQWQALSTSFLRTQESRYWGGSGNCSVLAGDFDDFAEFSSWWSGPLGRSLAEILNVAELSGGSWSAYSSTNPNPAALLFLLGLGSLPYVGPIDPYDPEQVAHVVTLIEGMTPSLVPTVSWVSGPIEVWLAPTSSLPVPEPGSLGLLGGALVAQISWASRRSRALAARRSGRARTSALRAAQAKRPES